jgi:HAD superfamily hydrolase (TIGR01509 family)
LIPKLFIFDFDGVVADSETLACGVAAAYATEIGAPMTAAEGLALLMGKRVADVAALITARGGTVPDNFAAELLNRTLQAFAVGLEPVAGVRQFLVTHSAIPRCIASSSSHARLATSLNRIGLSDWFKGRVFSVDDVSRGKPFPDIFLHAASTMQQAPADTLVIEDSVSGIKAGVAAGMPVVGLLAGSHLRDDDGTRLLAAGANAVVRTYDDLSAWIAATL